MWTRLRNYFLTGLVIAAPIGATIWITWSVIDWIDKLARPLIPAQADPSTYLRFTVPGFGVIFAIIVITLIGFLTANLVGRTMVGAGERLVDRMPLVRVIYRGVKQIAETVFADRTKNFKMVGLVEYPRKGLWVVCLVSTEAKGQIPTIIAADGEKVYTCLIPPSPVPTAGMMLFVRESDLIILDMSVEDAIKMIVSVGLVVPEFPRGPAKLTSREERQAKRRAAAAAGFKLHEPGPDSTTPDPEDAPAKPEEVSQP
ncbi:MAG: DUF502 domain-containing protein [Bauldia sp.]|nr:DUF502 domain-containing protein [Bauldia sp.]